MENQMDNAKNELDPISLEIIANSLRSITDECFVALTRSSYSTNIKERKDHSIAIVDKKGRLVDLRKKLDQAMTSTDSFGRDARSIMNTLNNIKDPGTVKETVEENSDKIKVFK